MMSLEFGKLLEQYDLMIWEQVHFWHRRYPSLDKEDLRQEGLLALHGLMMEHEPGNVPFGARLHQRLRWALKKWAAETMDVVRVPETTRYRHGWKKMVECVWLEGAKDEKERPLVDVLMRDEDLGRADDEEVRVLLAAAVSELPETERLVIDRRFYEGLTLQDTAETLGHGPQWVSGKQRQALEKLRARPELMEMQMEKRSANLRDVLNRVMRLHRDGCGREEILRLTGWRPDYAFEVARDAGIPWTGKPMAGRSDQHRQKAGRTRASRMLEMRAT